MAKVGAQRAAELTGRSKSTIQRAMNSGKLSYEVDANERRIIDVSELDRVFGLAPQDEGSKSGGNGHAENELQKAADMIEMERMKMRIRFLEDQLDSARQQMEDIKGQRDQWQKQAQQVLLTSQYSQKQAEELKEELKERDRKEQERRQHVLEQRMKQMKGQNQNKAPVQKGKPGGAQQPKETENAIPQAAENAGFDIQHLWQKIKGKTGTAN